MRNLLHKYSAPVHNAIPLSSPTEWLSFTHTDSYNTIKPSTISVSLLPATMASLQTISFSSPLSQCSQKPRHLQGITSGIVWHSSRSSFGGQALNTPVSRQTQRLKTSRTFTLPIQMVKPTIQFIPGKDEQTIPDVKLTKSRDGSNGMAIFKFDQPSVFDSSGEVGDITGFFMIDDEGTLQSVDVSAKFVNGRPAGIEAKYVMRTPRDWDRFMRFMERYANVNGLQFVKS
ncbi:hypothetical protein QVD17_17275 [Tagetes erecta]|uniref:Photosystem II reaction center Psb28 protein n=1 Tax=Tagetes erecta TaxID=13708 RepID=A0AAD8KWE6_TARER|nr:hypothetical protein QVD17_17275 [Tagetes erecta]